MFNDDFKSRYKTIPFATYCRNHKKGVLNHNDTSILHNHREIEIITVLDGNAVIHIGRESNPIQKGDVIIIPPYTIHGATAFADKDFYHYCLSFDLSIIPDKKLQEELEKGFISTKKIIKAQDTAAPLLSQLVKNAFDAHNKQKQGWELQVIGNMSVFFGLLKEHNYIKTSSYPVTNDICRDIMDYITHNYAEDITSSSAAMEFNISKSYFCRIFKQNFGQSFQNYVNMYRTEKAKVMLKTTNLPISEIALQVGFNSFSFFSKTFREYSGVTPSEYRKRD